MRLKNEKYSSLSNTAMYKHLDKLITKAKKAGMKDGVINIVQTLIDRDLYVRYDVRSTQKKIDDERTIEYNRYDRKKSDPIHERDVVAMKKMTIMAIYKNNCDVAAAESLKQ